MTPRSKRLALAPEAIGVEARASEQDHQSLRLWLRLLACTNQIEAELRRRLHAQFGMSLARFDFLAQLHRHPEGLSMTALSDDLMVTGGNVTGRTTELVKEGLVEKQVDAADRRSYRLRLTPKGRKTFERAATVHETWVISLFAGLAPAQSLQLSEGLGRLRVCADAASKLPPSAGVERGRRRHGTSPAPPSIR